MLVFQRHVREAPTNLHCLLFHNSAVLREKKKPPLSSALVSLLMAPEKCTLVMKTVGFRDLPSSNVSDPDNLLSVFCAGHGGGGRLGCGDV